MCIIIRWSRNCSASWAERFRTSSLLCTYKLCDYYTPISILSPFRFTPSLYAPILNLQDFSFTCIQSTTVLCDYSNKSFSNLVLSGLHRINMKLCGYVGFCNTKRLVILTPLFTSKQQQMPQAIHYKGKYVPV